MATDGPIGTEVFGAGLYELRLYVTSAAMMLDPSPNFEAISSIVELNASLEPVSIPIPSAALLALFGTGLVHWLQRGQKFRNRTS